MKTINKNRNTIKTINEGEGEDLREYVVVSLDENDRVLICDEILPKTKIFRVYLL